MTDSALAAILLGTAMPTELTWPDLVLRLLDTLIAGAAIGLNRGEHGKAPVCDFMAGLPLRQHAMSSRAMAM